MRVSTFGTYYDLAYKSTGISTEHGLWLMEAAAGEQEGEGRGEGARPTLSVVL